VCRRRQRRGNAGDELGESEGRTGTGAELEEQRGGEPVPLDVTFNMPVQWVLITSVSKKPRSPLLRRRRELGSTVADPRQGTIGHDPDE